MTTWVNSHRPGFFGKKRDNIVWTLNHLHGKDGWRLAWVVGEKSFTYEEACILFYERSYFEHIRRRPEDIQLLRSFGECIDNAPTNTQSGFDYSIQESGSTHIQDIAVRNVMRGLGVWFEGPRDHILTVRGSDSNGARFSPGNIQLFDTSLITQPSEAPRWAAKGSVEDFWQSNKWVQLRKES